jgi:hypothetical protein
MGDNLGLHVVADTIFKIFLIAPVKAKIFEKFPSTI